jgi:hypothetical protein
MEIWVHVAMPLEVLSCPGYLKCVNGSFIAISLASEIRIFDLVFPFMCCTMLPLVMVPISDLLKQIRGQVNIFFGQIFAESSYNSFENLKIKVQRSAFMGLSIS